jgi:hypothetical protein
MAQSGSIGGSAWVESGHSFPANANTMDAESMPSDKAQAARDKAKEIMLALQDGKPGDADRLMGKNENNNGTTPLGWFKSKISGSKKEKKEKKEKDAVIR